MSAKDKEQQISLYELKDRAKISSKDLARFLGYSHHQRISDIENGRLKMRSVAINLMRILIAAISGKKVQIFLSGNYTLEVTARFISTEEAVHNVANKARKGKR